MLVYAVYIITTDGRTILAETFHKNIPNDILLGGLTYCITEYGKGNYKIKI